MKSPFPQNQCEAQTRPLEDRTPARKVFQDVTEPTAYQTMTRACASAGVPHYHPHDLRHRRITVWHQSGVPARDLAERVGLLPYERILVGNVANGERFETYVIYGQPGAGLIQLNGATAHLGKIGDRVTIMNFGFFTPEEAVGHKPRVVVLNERNEVIRYESAAVLSDFHVVV